MILKTLTIHIYHYLKIGCVHPGFHGDGYCHDENNNEDCFYDGGDCCATDISAVNVIYCTECKCLEPEITTSSTTIIIETTITISITVYQNDYDYDYA